VLPNVGAAIFAAMTLVAVPFVGGLAGSTGRGTGGSKRGI
jgi:hypothetical protein